MQKRWCPHCVLQSYHQKFVHATHRGREYWRRGSGTDKKGRHCMSHQVNTLLIPNVQVNPSKLFHGVHNVIMYMYVYTFLEPMGFFSKDSNHNIIASHRLKFIEINWNWNVWNLPNYTCPSIVIIGDLKSIFNLTCTSSIG